MHTLSPQRLQELLVSTNVASLSPQARTRLGWIAAYVQSGLSVSETCDRLGIARSTFHRWIERFDPDDLSSLEEASHEPTTKRESATPSDVIALIRDLRTQTPFIGKEQIRTLLIQQYDIRISTSSIGRIIERECLYFGNSPLHMRKRMRATSESEEPRSSQLAARSSSCSCFWCSFWGSHSRKIRNVIGGTVVLGNLAFLAVYLATAHWEGQKEPDIRAQIIEDNDTHFFLDPTSNEQ